MATLLMGCEHSFTYKVWHADEFRHVREPSTNAAVAVYFAPARKDYLVAYDSLRDGDNTPRRQAYFLGEYQSHINETSKPRFASTNQPGLVPVPVNGDTNVLPCAEFQKQLTVHTADGNIGPYDLPTYRESAGTAEKVALTPLAVVGDASVVALILGVIGAIAYAGGCVNCGH